MGVHLYGRACYACCMCTLPLSPPPASSSPSAQPVVSLSLQAAPPPKAKDPKAKGGATDGPDVPEGSKLVPNPAVAPTHFIEVHAIMIVDGHYTYCGYGLQPMPLLIPS